MARAPRLTIEFAGDTPIYESENGRWMLHKDHAAEVEAAEQQRDRLLESIEAHKGACEYTSPSQYARADRALYETAEEVEKEKADAP